MQKALAEYEALAKELFGGRWRGERTDWAALQSAAAYLHDVHRQTAEGAYPQALLDYLSRGEASSVAKQHYDALLAGLNEGGKAVQALMEALQFNEGLRFRGGSFGSLLFSEQASLLTQWKENVAELHLAVGWNNLVDVAKEENLHALAGAAVDWPEAASHLLHAVQKPGTNTCCSRPLPAILPCANLSAALMKKSLRHFASWICSTFITTVRWLR